MLIIYFLFLILKTYKFVDGGVINTNGLKYDPTAYLNSNKLTSKDVRSARIISQEPFIISLETKDKEAGKETEPNRRKKLAKKRIRMSREAAEGSTEKLNRPKRCHHDRLKKYTQSKRDLLPLGKKTNPKNKTADPEMVTEPFRLPDTYAVSKDCPDCSTLSNDDQALLELIEEIRELKQKLKKLLIYVANSTASSENIPLDIESLRENEKPSKEPDDGAPDVDQLENVEDDGRSSSNKGQEDLGVSKKYEDQDDLEDHEDHKEHEVAEDNENKDVKDHDDQSEQEDLEDHGDHNNDEEVEDHGDPNENRDADDHDDQREQDLEDHGDHNEDKEAEGHGDHNEHLDVEDHDDQSEHDLEDHEDPNEHLDAKEHADHSEHEEVKKDNEDLEEQRGHQNNGKNQDEGDPDDHRNLGDPMEDPKDDEDLKDYEEFFANDKSILQNKINFLSSIIDETDNDTEKNKIPDDIIQKWRNSPLLNLLYIPEKHQYEYQLLDDFENQLERKDQSDDRKLVQDKIKYLQNILEAGDVKSRRRRDVDDHESPCHGKARRCARDRVSSSLNKEMFKSKKWMDDLKLKRSQSSTKCQCKCPECDKKEKSEEDSFEMEDFPYVGDFMSNDKLLKWNKKSANADPFMDDLDVYRERAKQILKSAQEILKRIKETESKMKADGGDYLEADWGGGAGGGYSTDKNSKVNDGDVEDLVLELVKKVGKRLQEKRKRLEESEVDSEDEEEEEEEEEKSDSNEDSEKNLTNKPDEFPELSDLEKIVLKKAEEGKIPPTKPEILEKIQDLVETTETESPETTQLPETTQARSSETTASPFLNLLKGTDVMRDQSPEEKTSTTDPTPEPIKLPDNLPVPDDNLQASKLGLNSTDSVEKLMDDFQDGKLDENDMKTIQNLDDKKLNNLFDQIDREEEEDEEQDCPEVTNECQKTCDCGNKSEDVDKYEIMKSFLLWIKEMHLYNVLDNYPKLQQNN